MVRSSIAVLLACLGLSACTSTEDDSPGGAGSGQGGSGASSSGADASNASGSSSNGEGGASNAVSGGGGVGGDQICADLCTHATALGCPTSGDCEGDCGAGFANAGDCADELELFMACVAYESTTCEDFETAPATCEDEGHALTDCTGM
jgi:hypothetical protein